MLLKGSLNVQICCTKLKDAQSNPLSTEDQTTLAKTTSVPPQNLFEEV